MKRRVTSLVAPPARGQRAPYRAAIRIAAACLLAGLAGCAAGPDYQRPAVPVATRYTATPVPARTASAAAPLGQEQALVESLAPDPQWWRALGSPALDLLIADAFEASPTLASVSATARQARELLAAHAGATRYPQVDSALGAQHLATSPASQGLSGEPRQFKLFAASVGLHYTVDLAGGNRRALEALAARADQRDVELAGARLALAANLATTAIVRARLAAQRDATAAIVRLQDEQLDLARARVRIGQAAPDEVSSLQAQVELTRAELPALRKQVQQAEHLLAVLAGRAPGAAVPAFTLADFTLPAALPLTLPSELVRTRPDILAAEALLHAANADYGMAVARLYPQIQLSASLGSQALTTGALFGGSSAVWSMVAQLTQPIFNRALPAEKRAALAAFDAAAANYQRVVLDALRNVADTLRAVEHDAQVLTALAAADAAAQASLQSMERQYRLGAASYLQLLIAQQQVQQTRRNMVAAQSQRLADTVALYQSVGRGTAVGREDAPASTRDKQNNNAKIDRHPNL